MSQEKKINEQCEVCRGTGLIQYRHPWGTLSQPATCYKCEGTGRRLLPCAPDDPFNRRQVEAICRAVCTVEGVDPDSDVYGDACDPQWSQYADAVAAALTRLSGDDHFIRPDNDLPDEHENEGWLFLCPKCESHYSVEGPTDTCPVCGWRNAAALPSTDNSGAE